MSLVHELSTRLIVILERDADRVATMDLEQSECPGRDVIVGVGCRWSPGADVKPRGVSVCGPGTADPSIPSEIWRRTGPGMFSAAEHGLEPRSIACRAEAGKPIFTHADVVGSARAG